MSKLTDKQICDILLRIDESSETLANKFGVSPEYIDILRKGKNTKALEVLKNLDDFERSLVDWRGKREIWALREFQKNPMLDRDVLRENYEGKNPRPF